MAAKRKYDYMFVCPRGHRIKLDKRPAKSIRKCNKCQNHMWLQVTNYKGNK